jgi:CubicO group peptidase (beta-lactamase class C family)
MAVSRHFVSLRTYALAFALTFAVLQAETCTPGNAELATLELRVGDAQGENTIKGFVPTGVFYEAALPPRPETAVLVVGARDPTATVEVTLDGQSVPLQNGSADIRPPFQGSQLDIRVSPAVGGAWTYQVHVERGHPTNTLLQFVDDYVAANTTQFDLAGLAIAVVGPQGVALQKTYGLANIEESIPVGLDTPFNLASVSKQFTATAAMILYEDGLLDPSDLIATVFPEGPPEWGAVTIHHLLTHTSGIPSFTQDTPARFNEGWTNEDVLAWAVGEPLEFVPGSQYDYSNTGYVLTAMLVERIAGQPFEEFLQQRIFAPVGMFSSSVHEEFPAPVPDRAVSYLQSLISEWPMNHMGSGRQYSSLNDLRIWEISLRNPEIISEQTLGMMRTHYATRPNPDCGYGYGWVICDFAGEPLNIYHTGRIHGYRNVIDLAPDEGVAVIMLSNGSYDWAIGFEYAVYRLYLGLDPLPTTPLSAAPKGACERPPAEPPGRTPYGIVWPCK